MKWTALLFACAIFLPADAAFAQYRSENRYGNSSSSYRGGADVNAWRKNDRYMDNRRLNESALHHEGRINRSDRDRYRGDRRRGNARWSDNRGERNPTERGNNSLSNRQNIIINNNIGQSTSSGNTTTPPAATPTT